MGNWKELLERIEDRSVIPVIGQELYWVEKAGQQDGCLLYDFLAEELAKEVKCKLTQGVNHKFSKAAFQFLEFWRKNESYYNAKRKLNQFLMDNLKTTKLAQDNPLSKLARIKPFNFFINTTYDNFLINALKKVRNHSCESLSYTLKDTKLDRLDDALFDKLEKSESTLVYNIYGNLHSKINSAFIEKDILETIISFHKDIETGPANRLSQELRGHSLLFIGCGYDDWLFRFFIRILSNQPFEIPTPENTETQWKYVCGDFDNTIKKESSAELIQFLLCYDSKVFYAHNGEKFVDTLFEKLERSLPHTIISPSEFPETAFISFPGENREIALQLESQLRKDGIKAWVDKREIRPGNKIDSTIMNAMKKCPVFIPLISKESQKLLNENGEQRYFFQEWNWVLLFNETEGNPPKIIIPVVIDNTDWMYEKFREFAYVKIPGGKGGEYEELKKRLLEIQQQIEG